MTFACEERGTELPSTLKVGRLRMLILPFLLYNTDMLHTLLNIMHGHPTSRIWQEYQLLTNISGERGCLVYPPGDQGVVTNWSSLDRTEHRPDVRHLLPRSGGSQGI